MVYDLRIIFKEYLHPMPATQDCLPFIHTILQAIF